MLTFANLKFTLAFANRSRFAGRRLVRKLFAGFHGCLCNRLGDPVVQRVVPLLLFLGGFAVAVSSAALAQTVKDSPPKIEGPTAQQEKVQMLTRAYDLVISGREYRWPEALVLAARMLREAEVEFERDPIVPKIVRAGKNSDDPILAFAAPQPAAESLHLLDEAIRMSRGTSSGPGIELLASTVKSIVSHTRMKLRVIDEILQPDQRNVYKLQANKGRPTYIHLRTARFDDAVECFIVSSNLTVTAKRPHTKLFAFPIIDHQYADPDISVNLTNLSKSALSFSMILQ